MSSGLDTWSLQCRLLICIKMVSSGSDQENGEHRFDINPDIRNVEIMQLQMQKHEVLVQFFLSHVCVEKVLFLVYYSISIAFGGKQHFVLLDKLLDCKQIKFLYLRLWTNRPIKDFLRKKNQPEGCLSPSVPSTICLLKFSL